MLLVLMAAAFLAAIAPQGVAQSQPVRPPKVETPAKAPTWLYYLVGAGAIVLCVGLAVFPSRRTHED